MNLTERINKCERPKRGRFQYLQSRALGDTKDEVVCSLCGEAIMNEKEIMGRLKLVPTGAYTEITIEFTDGSAHETSVCKTCSKKLTQEKVEYIYMSDIAQWQREMPNESFDHMNKEIKSWKLGSRVI